MTRYRRAAKDLDPELTVGGRLAAAFASLYFSLPICGLLWLVFNVALASTSGPLIPGSALVTAVAGFALLSFAFPRLTPSILGWLSELLVGLARYW